jgi:hypothetical protein
MTRPKITSVEMPRCEAMTEQTTYLDSHRCPYAVEAEDAVSKPHLCSKHKAKAKRRTITLNDGTQYTA